jgi:hypothetical protein
LKDEEGNRRITLRYILGIKVVKFGGGWEQLRIVPSAGYDISGIELSRYHATELLT